MNNHLVLIYAAWFICIVLISFLLNGLFLRFARTLGIRNNPEGVQRWSERQKPSLGGITFYVIFLLSTASYSIFFPQTTVLLNQSLLGLLGAVTLAFIMGLADDAYNTKPFFKFTVQVLCGVILISTGTSIHLFENEWMNYVLTVLWVVGIMNSINLIDNMDAIAACVSGFVFLEALLMLYIGKDFGNVDIIILLGVLGTLGGFLYYNWHPSRLYMGDTGSQFLGILTAAMGIRYFWNAPDFGQNVIATKQITIVLLGFLVPLTDTATVIINRILRGTSPFVGGKDHTTHHLSYLGLSDSQVAFALSGISMISMVLIFVVQGTITDWNITHQLIFGGYILAVAGGLFYITRIKKEKNETSDE
ncbi:MAG: UDP-N-acetylglucosamine:undecaprenyl-P N-acetylglucosaminyl 1-P transferase [Bacteroidetes bacterium]|nr:MAG: UDP-N-acetylglucosamine:undecaprenyl-P N-acetylglucosaminyl 1-P transferase [Bacteroidota bacterium]